MSSFAAISRMGYWPALLQHSQLPISGDWRVQVLRSEVSKFPWNFNVYSMYLRFRQVMKCRSILVLLPAFLTSRPLVVCIRKLRMIMHSLLLLTKIQLSYFFAQAFRKAPGTLDLLQCTFKCPKKVIQGSKRRRKAFLKQNLERRVAAIHVSHSAGLFLLHPLLHVSALGPPGICSSPTWRRVGKS